MNEQAERTSSALLPTKNSRKITGIRKSPCGNHPRNNWCIRETPPVAQASGCESDEEQKVHTASQHLATRTLVNYKKKVTWQPRNLADTAMGKWSVLIQPWRKTKVTNSRNIQHRLCNIPAPKAEPGSNHEERRNKSKLMHIPPGWNLLKCQGLKVKGRPRTYYRLRWLKKHNTQSISNAIHFNKTSSHKDGLKYKKDI